MSTDTAERLNKRDFELLGQVFMREIQGQLPAQIGRSKAVVALSQKGYIQPLTKTLPGRFPVTISGWELTESGRYIYCINCTEDRA